MNGAFLNRTRTIFITVFRGLIARNILTTDAFQILRNQPDLRIIILAPQEKQKRYQGEFGGKNIIVEGVGLPPSTPFTRFFDVLFQNLLDTSAGRIHRLVYRKQYRKYVSATIYWLVAQWGHFKIVRQFCRWLYFFVISRKHFYAPYFEKYRPSLVFATDVFQPGDIEIMVEAKARGIFLAGMVRSWDNITSKGLNKVIPDRLFVTTPFTQQEAITYSDFLEKNIEVVGVPHYDRYMRDKRISRQELCRRLNLDPAEKIIFFAPPSDLYSKNNPVTAPVIKALSKLDAQLIIRPYIAGKSDLGDIEPVDNKIAIDIPEGGIGFSQADLIKGDSHLADLLYHSDVVISFASTLVVDAVVFNKPNILLAFDGDQRPYWQSLRRFYGYEHQRSVIDTGGVKLAETLSELIKDVQQYLDDPHLDQEGRKKIVEERCWKLDGKSGERLGNTIIKYLNSVT